MTILPDRGTTAVLVCGMRCVASEIITFGEAVSPFVPLSQTEQAGVRSQIVMMKNQNEQGEKAKAAAELEMQQTQIADMKEYQQDEKAEEKFRDGIVIA